MSVSQVKEEALKAIDSAQELKTLEEIRLEYLSKKGKIQGLMAEMRNLPAEEKPAFGQMVNDLKTSVSDALDKKKQELEAKALAAELEKDKIDITLDAYTPAMGNLHPLTLVTRELEDTFIGMGYTIAEGPEVESDDYNFTRANTPEGHPARDMQDTFFIDPHTLLRTQTTAIQMRVLEKQGQTLPIKVFCPGKVYRKDDDDATHSHQFNQAEGLVVGENITLGDLKGTLELMVRSIFSKDATVRFRPSYFPFTEPSFEVDMSCFKCGGKGCSMCKGTGWIEILGSGMVHPNVLENAGIDSKKYTGFAFGVGLERVGMLKYGISDIRDLYTNDVRFLKGFKRAR